MQRTTTKGRHARFEVLVTLDEAEIEREGKRRGFTLERAHDTVIADVENTLFDVLRYKSGVGRVGVTLLSHPPSRQPALQ